MSGGARPKAKGSKFERQVCALLSMWVSNNKSADLFWRSAISGGRATRRVTKHGAQGVSGDICAVGEGGHALTSAYHIECKHVVNMAFASFVLKGNGFLATEWMRCRRQAVQHNKWPMLIAKQNLLPAIVVVSSDDMRALRLHEAEKSMSISLLDHDCSIWLLTDVLDSPFTVPRLRMRK